MLLGDGVPISIKEALVWGAQELSEFSPSPELDARVLLKSVASFDDTQLLTRPEHELTADQRDRYLSGIERRKRGEPVAYITGHKEFWGLDFEVTPAVLIPRPDTETLVQCALEIAAESPEHLNILDVGTGSGCIAVALATALNGQGRAVRMTALDSSAEALAVAQSNAQRLGVSELIEFKQSNWFSALQPAEQRFDMIISNPPYIAAGDTNVSPETSFEPHQALYADQDGLAAYHVFAQQALLHLRPTGVLLVECGWQQRAALEDIFGSLTWRVSFHKDLAGHNRVLVARL